MASEPIEPEVPTETEVQAGMEINRLHGVIYAQNNTIEALKHRCIELEFQIVDLMAEREARNKGFIPPDIGAMVDPSPSQLSDRDDG